MSIEWIEFKGKRILFANFCGIKKEKEIIATLELQKKMIQESLEPVLILVNVEDSVMTAEATAYSKEQLTQLNSKIKKVAAVGVTGLKAIIARAMVAYLGKANQELFPTIDKAKEWLVS